MGVSVDEGGSRVAHTLEHMLAMRFPRSDQMLFMVHIMLCYLFPKEERLQVER